MTTTLKTCFKCNTAKATTEFYRHGRMGDQLLGKCKECTKKDVRANYRSKISQYKEYEKARAMLPHRVKARKQYIQTDAGREAIRRAHKASAERYPDRTKAKNALGNAIRDGKVKKLPCFVCGEVAEAHHPAYSQPLDVVWLCNKHHREVHAMAKNAA